jgi:hypothetical protein
MVLYRLAAKDDTGTLRGLVPYAYDPTIDEKWPSDEEDMLHDPEGGMRYRRSGRGGES